MRFQKPYGILQTSNEVFLYVYASLPIWEILAPGNKIQKEEKFWTEYNFLIASMFLYILRANQKSAQSPRINNVSKMSGIKLIANL